jgi:tRNA-dihydrouridine synthase 1
MPMVKALAEGLKVPVFCKIRSLGTIESTVAFARALEDNGCTLITVHGRTKEMKRAHEGLADWQLIRAVRESVGIPVFANGNIRDYRDAVECLEATGCEGIMSAIGLLRNPRLFAEAAPAQSGDAAPDAAAGAPAPPAAPDAAVGTTGFCGGTDRVVTRPCPISMALEYIDYAERYPTHPKLPRGHLFWLIREILADHIDLRVRVATAVRIDDYRSAVLELQRRIAAGEPGPKALPDEMRQPSRKRVRRETEEARDRLKAEARAALRAAEIEAEARHPPPPQAPPS